MKTEKKPPLLIIAVLGVVIGPLLLNLPVWVAGWCLTFWGYAVLAHKKRWPWPGRVACLLLACTGFMMVLAFLGKGGPSGQMFIGLLSVMAGLKPLETKNHRDSVVTLLMAYFIIISSLFIIENFFITLYMFVSVLAATTCLVHLNVPGRQLKHNLRLTTIIMLQAMPLMVLLFILFPRAESIFFTLPGRYQGRSGFSESMQPGSLSRLVQEDRTAFRVQFQGEIPNAPALYWRGLVLWHFDGNSWTQGSVPDRYQPFFRGRNVFQYDVIMEPHRKKHLFALDLPLSAPPLARLTEDFTLMTRWPMRKSHRYQVRSSTDARQPERGHQGQGGLQLPENGNPEAKRLAKTWMSRLNSPEAVVNQAVRYFEQNEFSYTLKPPMLGENPVDDFIFGEKKGYCEHFASAFAYLMRAAGVPARIVIGYLGGDRNPYGDYLIVKQYHAHAWVEIFLDNQGWMRLDPTAIVAPERVTLGLADSLLSENLPQFLKQAGIGRIRLYFRKIAYMWDAVNLRWNAWFMEYSRLEQVRLLTGAISSVTGSRIIWVVGLVGLLAGMAVMGWIRFMASKKVEDQDVVKETYDLFCQKLEGVGIYRQAAQGPSDFAEMAGLIRHDLREPIEAISRQYIALRYMGRRDKASRQSFRRRVQKFDPK